LLVRRAVDTLGIREELLRRPASSGVQPATRSKAGSLAEPDVREDVAERSLVSLMLRFPSVLRSVQREAEVRQGLSTKWQKVVDLILGEWQERGDVDVFQVAQKVDPDHASEITSLALQGENIPEIECDRMAADCLSHLRRKSLRALERNLRLAIRAAEEQKDEQAKRERILEWQDVVRKERQLERRRLEPKTIIR
jgi:hypothetical protein